MHHDYCPCINNNDHDEEHKPHCLLGSAQVSAKLHSLADGQAPTWSADNSVQIKLPVENS
jgi:hypothetical protein